MQSCMKPSGITGMKMAEFFVNLLFVPQKGGLFLVNAHFLNILHIQVKHGLRCVFAR